MSDFDRNYATLRGVGTDRAVAYDMGLRAHMIRVYNYMAIGVALTGLVAWFTFQVAVVSTGAGALTLTPFGQSMFSSPLIYVLMFGPLALVFWISFGINRMSPATARLLFFVYAAALGLSLSTIFLAYTQTSITRVFFISAASFGALSLWGYTTQRDLTGIGSFLVMGLFGIIIASLVNVFLGSSTLQWVISVVGVLVFSGLTAWDTQRLKNEYVYGTLGGEALEKSAIMGALSLYLDFLNLFVMLLQLLGQREE